MDSCHLLQGFSTELLMHGIGTLMDGNETLMHGIGHPGVLVHATRSATMNAAA